MLKTTGANGSPLHCLPLQHVSIEATIRSFAADVVITQSFSHDQSSPIEAIYYFPIEDEAAVYAFTAKIDDREIVAQLKEKADEHHQQGTRPLRAPPVTNRLGGDESTQEHFTINIGAVPPSKVCQMTIAYVTELDLIQGSTIRFVVPKTIVSRPRTASKDKGKATHLPPVSYTIHFRCHIEKVTGPNQEQYITQLHSPSHQVNVERTVHDTYLVTFIEQNTYLDRDILLDIRLADQRANTFVAIESDAAMAAVTPFDEDSYINVNGQRVHEFIFLVDCSSSMRNENKIGLSREAMFFLLKHLPVNSHFNILLFGSIYRCLFNQTTVVYNRIHLRIAEKLIDQIQGDLGSTDFTAPLLWLKRHPPGPERVRQVFLLTDGECPNISETLELSRSIGDSTRIFSFGLGTSPNRSLIKGLARTTNGRYAFLPRNTRIDPYVEEQLHKALRRTITNIQVQWDLGVDVHNVPEHLPPACLNDRLIIYALASKQAIPSDHQSSVSIRTDQSYFRLDVIASDRLTKTNPMIARLAAKALILELQYRKTPLVSSRRIRFEDEKESRRAEQEIRQRIIDLSLRYHIISPYTTFTGLERRLHSDQQSRSTAREIPIDILSDQQPASPDRPRSAPRRSIPVQWIERDGTTVSMLPDPPKREIRALQRDLRSMTDGDIVRYLVSQQAANGLWDFESNMKIIEDLSGKSLRVFQSPETAGINQTLITAIMVVVLETKYRTFRSIWEDAADRARRCLIRLLDNDWNKFVTLFHEIRSIIDE